MHEAIIVFSHLRWSFVYQRPQQLLARMAERRRVVFFEEPVWDREAAPFLECSTPAPGVLVCRPHTPVRQPGYHDEQFPCLLPLLEQLLREERLERYLAWFYTPMALPLVATLTPRLVVYDCMDELSGFLEAPSELAERERALLARADLVFTGGPSLYQAKRRHHSQVFCFPSSVDAAHFRLACNAGIEHESQLSLPRPRLGYFGVLDERLDLPLLDALALSHPQWQIVMVGPVLKITPQALPRHTNISYYGQQEYAQLPRFLAGWDVCLIPFALNDATRFISPTKTLEYMAAEKPVVSTPITDVAEPYGGIVFIGNGIESFIAGCEQALGLSEQKQRDMVGAMRAVVAATSWDATVRAMEELIAAPSQR
ncbi:glycosyltransferase [Geomonas subterranea]|uniref:Glycosyltransferase n=1 Tax=Geomonas subterranea TaxID=2847989 RepID=A0ABX8LKK3_9BACT|nr:glycosyltransferase [Geomonas subterranea]QXE90090.1 glycosyltransferase [Geomonas subterranea]QXM07786.1 glycosyltransferase [Geomonas subterranea]